MQTLIRLIEPGETDKAYQIPVKITRFIVVKLVEVITSRALLNTVERLIF